MLNVALLGASSFAVGRTFAKSDLGPAGRLLACYLFEFMGRPHRRERLADLFWGELETDKARSALNTAVWRLRKLLDQGGAQGGRSLVTVGEDVLLEPGDFIQVDTHQLQNASRLATSVSKDRKLTPANEAEIAAAIDSYKGPFLDGDDGDWVLQERERLHCLFVGTTLQLMRFAARQSQYERALDLGRRILASDPLRESVQRDVMVLLVLNGQRADAIYAYENLRRSLKSDLSIEPMPDTKRLCEHILSGEIFEYIEAYAYSQFGADVPVRGQRSHLTV